MTTQRDRGYEHATIRPWADGDLRLLHRLLGEPEMTRFLGGPESPEVIDARHQRYLTADPATNGLFAATAGEDGEAVGWVGFWATALLLEEARRRGRHRLVHAFPSVDNDASNALCRTLGFRCLGEVEVEYPKGHLMRSNDWQYELWPPHDTRETTTGGSRG